MRRSWVSPRRELLTLKQAKGYLAKLNKKSKRKNMPKKLLEGIKVADFTWVCRGPSNNQDSC